MEQNGSNERDPVQLVGFKVPSAAEEQIRHDCVTIKVNGSAPSDTGFGERLGGRHKYSVSGNTTDSPTESPGDVFERFVRDRTSRLVGMLEKLSPQRSPPVGAGSRSRCWEPVTARVVATGSGGGGGRSAPVSPTPRDDEERRPAISPSLSESQSLRNDNFFFFGGRCAGSNSTGSVPGSESGRSNGNNMDAVSEAPSSVATITSAESVGAASATSATSKTPSSGTTTSRPATYQMTTSKSVFEFCADTNTYRFSTERMTQSYEQPFDYSDSEDEDETTETASCSSREDDVTSLGSNENQRVEHPTNCHDSFEKSDAGLKNAAFRAAQELLTSERSYVRVLHLIDQVFQFRIDHDNRARPMFPKEVITRMFSNVKSIYKLHNDFLLQQLEQRIATWDSTPHIGDIMKSFAPFLKMYTEYVKNFDDANTTVTVWLAKSQRFAAIVDEIQKMPECGNLALQHHMLAPVQRVPRYELLLKDYLRKLPEDSSDRSDTEEALRLVASAASQSNEAAKKIDKFKKLLEVQDSLGGSVDLISPTRELLKSGKLLKISARSGDHQERHLFLLTDLLLLCSARRIANRMYSPSASYCVRAKLLVDGLEIIEGDNLLTANTFYIRNSHKSIELYTQTPDERDDWIKALESAVEDLRVRKSSLKIGNEEINANEHEAPPILMSTTADGLSEACQICKSTFGTFRRRQTCRACGKTVCSKCSGQKIQLPCDNGGRPHRVCRICHDFFSRNNSTTSVHPSGKTTAPCGAAISTTSNTPRTADRASQTGRGIGSLPVTPDGDQMSLERLSALMLRRGILEVKAVDEGVLNGFLNLRTRGKTWTERWFLLKHEFVLYSFASKEDIRAMTSTPVPGFQIGVCDRSEGLDRDHVFKLFHKKKAYCFQAHNNEDMQRWIVALERASRAELLSP